MYSLFAAATWECRFSTLDLVTRHVSQLITLHLLSKKMYPLFAATTWGCSFSKLDLLPRRISQLITQRPLSINVFPLFACNVRMLISGPLSSSTAPRAQYLQRLGRFVNILPTFLAVSSMAVEDA